MIAAKGTRETAVYEKLDGKLERMGNLLHVFAATTSTR
jgi:hypothetical protein